jgi:hypothetical protein
MCLENWDDTAQMTYDHATLLEVISRRFIDAGLASWREGDPVTVSGTTVVVR